MSESITLLGAEEVQRAASRIHEAAETMSRAFSGFEAAIDRINQRLDHLNVLLEQQEADKNRDGGAA